MSGRVAVFVKTPGVSPLKTRLAAEIGAEAAEAFFTRSVGCVQAAVDAFVAGQAGWEPVWVVAEQAAVRDGRWRHLSDGWPAVWAGAGDLGARMQRAWDGGLASHGASMLLGADTPQIDPSDLVAAVAAVDGGRVVVGPSTDGGFWMLAGRVALPEAAWRDTPWSRPDTLARLREALPMALDEVATFTDVDTLDDLRACRPQLRPELEPSHRRLVRWLDGLPSPGPR